MVARREEGVQRVPCPDSAIRKMRIGRFYVRILSGRVGRAVGGLVGGRAGVPKSAIARSEPSMSFSGESSGCGEDGGCWRWESRWPIDALDRT